MLLYYVTKSRLDVQFVQKISSERGMIKFNNGSYIKLSIHLLLKDLSITCYEAQVLNTHLLSKEELLSVMLWCSVYLYYTALPNKARTQILCIADLYKFLIKT